MKHLLVIVVVLIVSVVGTSTTTRDMSAAQRRFNAIKKKLEKQQAKKSITNHFSFKSLDRGNMNTTSEYDPILKKPTSSPFTRKNKILSLSNKIMNRNLNDLKLSPKVTSGSGGFSFGSKSSDRNVGHQSNNRVLGEKSTLSNQCWSSPCLNGSSCYGSSASYFCYCSNGYTGSNCESKISKRKIS